jgi:molecular chaperone DnaJ
LPSLHSRTRGDQVVQIFVEVPTRLTDRQRELLGEFARDSSTEVSPVTRGFLDKLRDFLG